MEKTLENIGSSIVTAINLSEATSNYKGKKRVLDVSSKTEIFVLFCRTLIRQAVRDIYVTTISDVSEEMIIDVLPEYMKGHVHLEDIDGQLHKRVISMILPIFDELEWNIKKGIVDKERLPFGHFHELCIISENLRVLKLAEKRRAEADVDIDYSRHYIKTLRKFLKNRDNQVLLDRIEGVFVAYDGSRKIGALDRIEGKDMPSKFMRDLFEDAKMIELSKSRYLLGIHGKVGYSIQSIKKWVREIIEDEEAKKYLNAMRQTVNFATRLAGIGVAIPEISIGQGVNHIPVVSSLYDIKPNCLKTLRVEYDESSD